MLPGVATEVSQAKRALRLRLGARRRSVPPAQAAAAAAACAEHLLAVAGIRGALRLALYAALPDELPTRPLFEALGELGIPRLLPRVGADGALGFAAVERWEDLAPGRYGVPEPPPHAAELRLGAGDWVLVPGLAFDAAGWRLGRGGGHYDRALAGWAGPRVVGLGYAFQLVEQVPRDSHDRPVDAIVTERGWCWARREGA
jgi:5-formyltetrahydrofolate cyclo-ligase